jgi:hypothetical protein
MPSLDELLQSALSWTKGRRLAGTIGGAEAAQPSAGDSPSSWLRLPVLLPKGFDLTGDSEEEKLNLQAGQLNLQANQKPGESCRSSFADSTNAGWDAISDENSLEGRSPRDSLEDDGTAALQTGPRTVAASATKSVPLVPHRSFTHRQRTDILQTLRGLPPAEAMEHLPRLSRWDLLGLFRSMERDGLWVQALNMVRGLELARCKARSFTAEHADSVLRTLFKASCTGKAVRFYLTEAKELPIASGVSELVLQAAGDMSGKYIHEVLEALVAHRHGGYRSFTQGMHVAAITSLGRHHRWLQALEMLLERANGSHSQGGMSAVYQTLFPMAVASCPQHCQRLLDYAREVSKEPAESIAELLLRSLSSNPHLVVPIADRFLRGLEKPTPSSREPLSLFSSKPTGAVPLLFSAPAPTWIMACRLYAFRPTGSNLTHLLQASIAQSSVIALSLPRYLTSVSLSAADAQRLAGVLAASHSHLSSAQRWTAALGLATPLLQRKHYAAMPSLTAALVLNENWSAALRLLTVMLCNRERLVRGVVEPTGPRDAPAPVLRGVSVGPTSHEFATCVYACLRQGKWDSALFWLERAHSFGHCFSEALYDQLFASCSAGRVSWDDALRVAASMQDVGGRVSELGASGILNSSGVEHRDAALGILRNTSTLEWKEPY